MGYTITIGQLKVEKEPDDGLDCSCIRFSAELAHHENAPAFGEPTDRENQRWPSYGVWSDFMRATGLYDVFFYESGHLIGGHPGIRLVTRELVDVVSAALIAYREAKPDARPDLNDGQLSSSWLCRLIWLDYWLRWSFESCETPVIVNS